MVFGRVKLEALFSHVSETSYNQKIAYCRNEPLPASAGCHEAMKEQHVLGGGAGGTEWKLSAMCFLQCGVHDC